ncbi:MAG: hypothetical protein Q4G68_03835 [Planctomycetia bacterium]|nr:hypothetical protein [Planctomycetia bacterium]
MDEIVSTLIFEIDTSAAVNELEKFEAHMAACLERLDGHLNEFAQSVARTGLEVPELASESVTPALPKSTPIPDTPDSFTPAQPTSDLGNAPSKNLNEAAVTPPSRREPEVTLPEQTARKPDSYREFREPGLSPAELLSVDNVVPFEPPARPETSAPVSNPEPDYRSLSRGLNENPMFDMPTRALPSVTNERYWRTPQAFTDFPTPDSTQPEPSNTFDSHPFDFPAETRAPTLPEDSLEKLTSQNSTMVSLTETIVQYLKGLAEPQPEYYKVDVE